MHHTPQLALLVCIACLAGAADSTAAGTWTLRSQDGQNGKICSLSTTDQGRPFSISVSRISRSTDQGVVGVLFEDPKVVQAGTKTLARLEFDNGTSGSHRLEAKPGGASLVPIVASSVQDSLRAFSESRRLTIVTRIGSTSFSLDGIADHVPELFQCASR